MKILFFGDIIGRPGREAIKEILPQWKKKYQPDLVLANGENLAHGLGVSERTLKEVLEAGVDLITSGNHIFDKTEAIPLLEDKEISLLRPANYPPMVPGRGCQIIEIGIKKILVINLNGRLFFKESLDCPFREADRILEEYEDEKTAAIIVDFHAEATSEKVVMGHYLDGRVSAVLGTHTHIPTADDKILPAGTAYISDIGMVGPAYSVIGIDKDVIIKEFLTQIRQKKGEIAQGPVEINAVLLETDNQGRAKKIERLREIIDLAN
ncbi:MAG: metallophosphoesterase [Candidatus Portnoybacteria bacterium RIFCSPLOWO2_01_FULL_43_11]|uniref:Metallophosphoesterase n=2 Tax=Candidatus Portnoyibacteriota TaxID=1817913 RepID=A0A1G2FBL3_9BACT|nr:MAG: metallophosphoesterase [Candidatus Portnoybacteria bacterium RIFCSPHIGHO2_01_FULL_40_12b]OGZ36974.1 MAG: metallophosphoesterase [Candidatus Portnoybacteria bacterium RIFCSPHIGHO2_02_FULL_40_23]OGZ38274.1 MAG: metallophosphoesterase [Candidatus Portnoybacteria bacterium RIFCSPLOWO2_01_FULL_43_11]